MSPSQEIVQVVRTWTSSAFALEVGPVRPFGPKACVARLHNIPEGIETESDKEKLDMADKLGETGPALARQALTAGGRVQ